MCLVPSPVSFNALDGWRVEMVEGTEEKTNGGKNNERYFYETVT